MLLKRDTPISGVFDLDAPDGPEALDSSGVPTPRGVAWSNDHLTTSEPLPVVTAKTEPTERGLGVPPPPTSAEVAWHSQMPPIASLSPLSLDTFEAGVPTPRVARAEAGAAAKVEPTENERITVPAPALPANSVRNRRRVISASIVAAAALLVFLVARRGASGPESASAAAARALAPTSNAFPAVEANTPLPAPVQTPPETLLPAETSANAHVDEAEHTSKPATDGRSSTHRRSHAKGHVPARSTSAPSSTDTSVIDPWHGGGSVAPARPVFSLPPR
jgi:hypothetical protein